MIFLNKEYFKHCFWLQILGDHSRFIHDALAPVEKTAIEQASIYYSSI